MTCDDFDRLMADALEQDAPLPKELRAHVAGCAACRATLEALELIREMEQATTPERDEQAWAGFTSTLDARLRKPVASTWGRRALLLSAAATLLVALVIGLLHEGPTAATPPVALSDVPAASVERALVDAGFEDEGAEDATDAGLALASTSSASAWEDPVDSLARELAEDLDEQDQRALAARIAEAFPG